MRAIRTIKAEMYSAYAIANALQKELQDAEAAARARKIAKCEHNYVRIGNRYWEDNVAYDTSYDVCTKCAHTKNRVTEKSACNGEYR